MTGAMAEQKLSRHGGGNCYLIRYSEGRKDFMVSVMRRNIQNTSQPTYQHFILNVTKEDGHNIYEIEGSKKKFMDISSLFEFYETNPLTPSMTTIGNPCSPCTSNVANVCYVCMQHSHVAFISLFVMLNTITCAVWVNIQRGMNPQDRCLV